jgi:hypothetical protein
MVAKEDPRYKQIAFDRCLDYLNAAIVLLSQPPTPKMRQQGWTVRQLGELRSLVSAWQEDFLEDGKITPRQHRVMIRWFLDVDLDFEAVQLLLANVDNTVYEALH